MFHQQHRCEDQFRRSRKSRAYWHDTPRFAAQLLSCSSPLDLKHLSLSSRAKRTWQKRAPQIVEAEEPRRKVIQMAKRNPQRQLGLQVAKLRIVEPVVVRSPRMSGKPRSCWFCRHPIGSTNSKLVLCKISRTIQESLILKIRPVPLPKIN
jgi:hypothetical protein